MKSIALTTGLLFSALLAAPLSAAVHISEVQVEDETGFELEVITNKLHFPWGIDWFEDGSAIITEQAGTVRIFRDGRLGPAIDFPAEVATGGPGGITRGQGGLMDVAISPDFDSSGWLYFTYSSGDQEANRTELARAKLSRDSLVDFETIWRNPIDKNGGQHFGSRILFLPDGTLLLSVGDGGNPPVSYKGDDIRKQAQNTATPFGKVLRLNPDGSIPSDNPDFGSGALPGLWTYGHRNIQGIHRDTETGQIWANEHGAFYGDEINLLTAGENYGWPAATFSVNYGVKTKISDHTELPGMISPKITWLRRHAPSGLLVYRGDEFKDWNGAVFSGGLKSEDLRVVKNADEPASIIETRIPIDRRVRDISMSPEGTLYVLTDHKKGELIRITPTQ